MKEPEVSVALLNENEISFELSGNYSCDIIKNASGNFKAVIDDNKRIKITGQDVDAVSENGILFVPGDIQNSSFLIKDVVIGIDFHWEKKEDQRFRGALKLIIENDKLTAVNVIGVEEYLMSVISSEMSATSSEELLKAHSIISRSWLIAQIEKRGELKKSGSDNSSVIQEEGKLIKWFDREDHELYDVCADDHCQRYQGITKIIDGKSRKAIEFTRGMLLTYDGKICDARYSKSCGGISENFENVWEPVEHKYLKKIVDSPNDDVNGVIDLTIEEESQKWIRSSPEAFCNTSDEKVLSQVLVDFDQSTTDFYRWKVEYTQDEISSLIKKRLNADLGNIIDLVPIKRGVSGRLIELKIVGSEKSLIIGKELLIRKALSESHLYSSAFVVDKDEIENGIPNKFILTGAGWGHGVGLCQIGAAVMGEQGYKYDEILLHYFTGAGIEKIYE